MTRAGVWIVLSAALATAGCGRSGGGDGNLATVGNEPITQSSLDAELQANNTPQADNPEVRRAALEEIVNRKLLAQAARAAKLDRSREARAIRAVGAETLEAALEVADIQAKVAKPTPSEVTAFIQAHPEMFARRTLYLVERLYVQGAADAALVAALKPTKTLEEVARVLDARARPYRRNVEQLDTLRANPRLTAAIQSLAPGEPLVLNDAGELTVASVRQSAMQPIVERQATNLAGELMLAQRQAKAVKDRIAALRAERVKYADATKPN